MADLSGYSPIYVRSNGNDTTGSGTLVSPYLTAQKAFEVAYNGTGNKVLDFGAGSFGGVNLNTANASEWPVRIAVRGSSSTQSFLGGIQGIGSDGSYFEAIMDVPAGNGPNITIISNNSINLGNIDTIGGSINSNSYGGNPPGNGGSITLTDCVSYDINSHGGFSGAYSYWGYYGKSGNVILNNASCRDINVSGSQNYFSGDQGDAGNVTIINSVCRNIDARGGFGMYNGSAGDGGNVSISNSNVSGYINNYSGNAQFLGGGNDGILTLINSTIGQGYSASVVDNGNNTGFWSSIFHILSVSTTLNMYGNGVWNNNYYRLGSLAFAVPSTIYVSINGSDSTGDASSNSPLRTAQLAYEIAKASTGNRTLNFGSGTFNGITINENWPNRISLVGAGATQSFLGGITGNGTPAVYNWNYGNCISGSTPGKNITITGDKSINLGNITSNGGGGNNPCVNPADTHGGYINLTNCVADNIQANGTSDDQTEQTGTGGTVLLNNCISGNINANSGSANAYQNGGTVTVIDSTTGDINTSAADGAAGGAGGIITCTNSNVGSLISYGCNSEGFWGNGGVVELLGKQPIPSINGASSINCKNLKKGKGLYKSDILSLPSKNYNIPVSLLLHFDGNTSDSSESNLVPSFTNVTFGNPKYGSNSAEFAGENFISWSNNNAFNLTGEFPYTIEFWMWLEDYAYYYTTVACKRNSNWQWLIGFSDPESRKLYASATCQTVGDYSQVNTQFEIPLQEWTHVALCVNNGTAKFFINGSLADEQPWAIQPDNGAQMFLGQNSGNSEYFIGKIDDFRIIKGASIYTNTFTPPTSALESFIKIYN